jgi:ribonuclease HI
VRALQLSRKWQQRKPYLEALAASIEELALAAQRLPSHRGRSKAEAMCALVQALAPAATKASTAAMHLHMLIDRHARELEWDGTTTLSLVPGGLALTEEDRVLAGGLGRGTAPEGVKGGVPAKALAKATTATVAELQALLTAIEQAAADVTSALQEHASRVHHAPASTGAL